ncbi:hypothetical protein HDU87_004823 [Geranomyces variabilis]|uniref:Proteasome assembly chaperone 1 n=1 Tax=Geranomyces variabilis TaxID=109894 RepID=A0AAD5XLM7_9FUNG|nr:hypothetical protein HDU87_004823 [Geranomyces variabilis]
MDVWPYQVDLGVRDFEAEELEEIEAAQNPTPEEERPAFEWVADVDAKARATPALLLLGLPGAGALFLKSTFQLQKPVARLTRQTEEKKSIWENQKAAEKTFVIYELPDDPTTLIAICQLDITPEQSPAWANELFAHIAPKTTIILDSFTANQIRQTNDDITPPMLLKLRTSAADKSDKIPFFPTPSLVSGPAAAFLTWLQVRQLPATLYVSLLETQMGRHDVITATLRAFEQLLPGLPPHVAKSATKPSTAEYAKAISSVAQKATHHLYL